MVPQAGTIASGIPEAADEWLDQKIRRSEDQKMECTGWWRRLLFAPGGTLISP